MKLNASTDLRLSGKNTPVKYEMFNGVMKILSDNEDVNEINLVSTVNSGGNMSSIKLKFNNTILTIRSPPDLINCAVERSEYTDSADVFNKVNEGMFYFNKLLLNPH